MAQCALSPQEFIQNAFNPFVAVLCSSKAEAVCRKNNLSFVEMVQPFCKLNTETHLRDPMNQSYVVKNLRIALCDMNYEPPKPLVARKMLYEVIANTFPNAGDRSRTSTIKANGYSIQINNSTPWFEAYRDSFLKLAPATDHEFVNHYLACVFVVAANDTEVLMEFSKLSQQQQHHQQQSANKSTWFFPVTLRYYVLLHDVTECDLMKTETLYKTLQGTYGAINCFLLQINSRHPSSNTKSMEESQINLPDPWSQFLTQKINVDVPDTDPTTHSVHRYPAPMNLSDQQEYAETEQDNSTSVFGVFNHPLMPDHPEEEGTSFSTESYIFNGDSSINSTEFGSNMNYDGQLSSPIASEMLLQTPGAGEQPSHAVIQHGVCLTLGDVEQLRLFVQEFCLKALLPFVEKQINALHEAVANRKGLHRSFFSATKKWFGGNKPAPVSGSVATSFVIYSPEAIELQVRRLGDLAFMFQNYDLAYHAYHNLKRDFNNDQAWVHFAGALEMAALAVFMQGTSGQRQLPLHYFDNAVTTYMNTCKSLHFATRATLLSTECLKHYERYLDAASYFIRLTSEESDLRSALLLEQAAHCFANLKMPYVRKYAFYMILAGHRYNKAGQKRHSLRSYKQALQVYEGQQWLFAEDHINLITGRLNFSLNHLEDALCCFHRLLYDGSLQCETQQTYYLREYLAICDYLWGANGAQNGHFRELPLPVVDSQNCRVLLGDIKAAEHSVDPQSGDPNDVCGALEGEEFIWYSLEEKAILQAVGSIPVGHKPLLYSCSATTNNSQHPVAVVDESITVELNLRNPLKVPLCLGCIRLLWAFCSTTDVPPSDSDWVTNAQPKGELQQSNVVETRNIDCLVLGELQSKKVNLAVIPHQTGKLHIQGVAYNLMMQPNGTSTDDDSRRQASAAAAATASFSVTGMQKLTVAGPRMNTTKEERCGRIYREDKRLEPIIAPSMPCLVSLAGQKSIFVPSPQTFAQFRTWDLKFPWQTRQDCGLVFHLEVANPVLSLPWRFQVQVRNWAKVRQHDVPTSVLCGEVVPVAFEFYNHGRVGLRRLLLSTSHPHVLAMGMATAVQPNRSLDGDRLVARAAEEHYVHAKSVIAVPLPPNWDALEPGKSFWASAWIRGPDTSGSHLINLLFYYETLEEDQQPNTHRLRHRVFRCQMKLRTSSVVTASAIALSGSKPEGNDLCQNATVAVEVTNSDHQVDGGYAPQLLLTQISCVSPRWTMELINKTKLSGVIVGTKETLHFCFRAVEQVKKEIDTGQFHFSNIAFTDKEIDSGASPCFDFLRKTMELSAKEADELAKSARPEKDVDDLHSNKKKTVETSSSLNVKLSLVVFWEVRYRNDNVVCGQHHLHITDDDVFVSTRPETKAVEDRPPVRFVSDIDGAAAAAAYSKLVQVGDALHRSSKLLKYFLFANPNVDHDFSVTRVCTIPVFLVLYNCVEVEVTATIDTGNVAAPPWASSASSSSSSGAVAETSHFVWVGVTHCKATLDPRATQVVKLYACFFKHGTYALNGVTVVAGLSTALGGGVGSHDGGGHAQQSGGVGQIVFVRNSSSSSSVVT